MNQSKLETTPTPVATNTDFFLLIKFKKSNCQPIANKIQATSED